MIRAVLMSWASSLGQKMPFSWVQVPSRLPVRPCTNTILQGAPLVNSTSNRIARTLNILEIGIARLSFDFDTNRSIRRVQVRLLWSRGSVCPQNHCSLRWDCRLSFRLLTSPEQFLEGIPHYGVCPNKIRRLEHSNIVAGCWGRASLSRNSKDNSSFSLSSCW